MLPRKRISRFVGHLADYQGPKILVDQAVRTFIGVYNVDMSSAVVPPGGYRSFNQFFTRRLQTSARPIDAHPTSVVSPADGTVEGFGAIDLEGQLTIKGRPYDVTDLLGDPRSATRYRDGAYFVVYLSPRDYHRVHSPVGGTLRELRRIPGTLYPVNRLGTEHVDKLFARNERVSFVLDSPDYGEVSVVMVGAIGVGRIEVTVATDSPPDLSGGLVRYSENGPPVERGDELGAFNLGSTVIVFLGPRFRAERRIEFGAHVRVGQVVARGGEVSEVVAGE